MQNILIIPHSAVIWGAEQIESLRKRLMSFTVNKQVTTASAKRQSCMLVLSDKTTKIQAVESETQVFIVDFNVTRKHVFMEHRNSYVNI